MGGQEHSLVVRGEGSARADDGSFFSILRQRSGQERGCVLRNAHGSNLWGLYVRQLIPLGHGLGTHIETNASLALEVVESFVEDGELYHVLVPIVCGY